MVQGIEMQIILYPKSHVSQKHCKLAPTVKTSFLGKVPINMEHRNAFTDKPKASTGI